MIKTVTDLVCGMVIEVVNAAAQTTLEGRTYYFCSQGCKDKFDKDPHKYLDRMRDPERHH